MKAIAALLVMSFIAGVVWAQTDQPNAPNASNEVIAEVLGKKLAATDKDNLNVLIFGALLEQFAKENRIEPTEEELDAFVLKTEEEERQHQIKFTEDRNKLREELKVPTLSEKERKEKEVYLQTIESILKTASEMKDQTREMEEQLRPMKRQMAYQFVRQWKINKALYAQYGGRVIFQQAGLEPLDAYRDFLKEQEQKGAFQIFDKNVEANFWRYFTNDAMHSFYSQDEGAKFINTPWWMMEELPDE